MKGVAKMNRTIINLHIMHDIINGRFNIDSLQVIQFIDVQNILHPIVRREFDAIENFADLAKISQDGPIVCLHFQL